MSRLAFGGGYGGNGLGVKLVPLPIVQADADADSYVVDAIGAAGTNLTGAGGGLTGADLVLTQYGNVGTDGVNRVITDGSYQCFVGTYGLYSLPYTSPMGFSIIHRVTDINVASANSDICNLWLGEASDDEAIRYNIKPSNPSKTVATVSDDLGIGVTSARISGFPVANTPYMIVLSFDYVSGLCFSGIKIDDGKFPAALSEFVLMAFNFNPPMTPPINALNSCYVNSGGSENRALAGDRWVAYVSDVSGGHTLRHITVSKKPCLVPA